MTLESGLSRALFLVLVLGGAAVMAGAHSARTRGLAGLAVLLAVVLDAITHTPNQNPTVPLRAYGPLGIENRITARLGASRAFVDPRLQAFLTQAATPDPFTYYTGVRSALFLDCNLLDDIPTTGGFFSLGLRGMTNVEALLTDAAEPGRGPLADFVGASQISSPDLPVQWRDRSSFMPPATAGQKPIFAGPEETLKAVGSADFAPRTTVYLPPAAQDALGVSNRTTAQVVAVNFRAAREEWDVTADQPALMVVSQAFYHPWRAYVDDRSVGLWRADYAFQALEVPSGKHRVRLQYEDWMFRLGVAISLLTLAGCVLAWFKRGLNPAP